MHTILKHIEEASTICVFRHQNPDADALGSQWGLVSWIKDKYPDKPVFAMGHHVGSSPELFGQYQSVSDEFVASSLAFVLDTANAERIDDQRYKTAQFIIKIDHHPFHEVYGHYEFIQDEAASTSEIVAELLYTFDSNPLQPDTATYLYMGILADSLRFSTRSTSYKTLKSAAYLVLSPINLGQINEDLFGMDEHEFAFTNYIRSNAVYEKGGLVYIKILQEDLKSLKISQAKAKEKVNELGLVRSFKIWALFIQQTQAEGGLYNGSLRSRSLVVNDIAHHYHGGGHKLAAAVKNLDDQSIESLLADLRQRIKEHV